MYAKKMVGLDIVHTDQAPFFMRTEFQPLGDVRVAKITGTAADYVRNRQLVQDGNDDLVLIFNLSKPLLALQDGKEIPLKSMDSVLIDCARPATVASVLGTVGHPYQMFCMRVPRAGMLIRAPLAEQQIMVPFEAKDTSRLLVSYLNLLSQAGIKQDSNLGGVAGGHVLDLIGLMLGATRDAEWGAKQGGVRAARLAEAQKYIRDHYRRRSLTVRQAAADLKISERYLHDLLARSGESFIDSVIHLRLERAKEMLGDPKYRRVRIVDIAMAVGFNDLSNFNKLFRRRYGDTPTGFRK
ncbi:MAG: AraC family transcriptional regulator [Methylococcus sp.]|nr:AraC family transcriptional regulator [Methylococcus sp.]